MIKLYSDDCFNIFPQLEDNSKEESYFDIAKERIENA